MPAFAVARVTKVVVRKLVHEDDIRVSVERSIEIEFLEVVGAERHIARRNARDSLAKTFEIGTTLGFDPADCDALSLACKRRASVSNRRVFPAPGAAAT